MKHFIIVTVAASIALLSGCSSMKVNSEKTAEFDFSTVETYEWVKAPEKILNESDTTLSEGLHTLMNDGLAARGWKQVLESDLADIQVIYYIKLSEHEEYTTPPTSQEPRVTGGFTYNNDSGTWNANDQSPDLNVYTVEEGVLTLLIYDTKANQRVWKGTLQTKIDRGQSTEQLNEMLSTVARKIIAEIP